MIAQLVLSEASGACSPDDFDRLLRLAAFLRLLTAYVTFEQNLTTPPVIRKEIFVDGNAMLS